MLSRKSESFWNEFDKTKQKMRKESQQVKNRMKMGGSVNNLNHGSDGDEFLTRTRVGTKL